MNNEELQHHETNPQMEFEREDWKPRRVYTFLVALAIAGILVHIGLWGLYRVLDRYNATHQPPPNPLVESRADTRDVSPEEPQRFPEPRLEKNERLEINDFRLREEQTLNTYGWVDQKAGVLHIPIERAMQLIAERGLPTTPRVGTIPPSEVNVVNQAAERADVSNLPKKKQK